MKKVINFHAIVIMAMLLSGCKTYLHVDTQILQEQIYEPTAVKYSGLKSSTVLYLDHSTCVIDAVQNSAVWRAMFPNLSQYSDELVLIKEREFERIALDRENNQVAAVLKRIDRDIPYADIEKAVEEICKGDNQAVLISDFEAFDKNPGGLVTRTQDMVPYLSPWLKIWLEKGYSIYIITERYQENTYLKKRFYFIFTDDRMQAPISHNLLGEIQQLLQNGDSTLFKMTNIDIRVESPKSDMVAQDLTFNVEYYPGFEFVTIDDSWDAIREYVMKLNKYGQPIPGDEPEPLIKNLVFSDGKNYTVGDVKIVASNITAQYLSKDCDGAENLKLDCSSINPIETDISDGFMLDKEALKQKKLNVMLTDKIFSNDYLSDEFGGNLLRLDFVITSFGFQPYDPGMFEWQSLYKNQTAICVSKSIENALRDVNVVPTNPNRRVIHTIFIKTE